MKLDDTGLTLLNKLGFEVKEGRIVEASNLSIDDLEYAGFGTYISKSNQVFEKKGEELVEVTNEELEAEKRFIDSTLKNSSL